MNVLIVDDRPSNRKLLRAVFEGDGMTVREAADGEEALAALAREPVDAIVSDLAMPRMDGFRLCSEVRRHREFSGVPFVAYSASYTTSGDRQLIQELGADRFLLKPAPAAVLTRTVTDLVNATDRRHPPARPDSELLKDYNQRLAAKLEEKNAALAAKVERLAAADEELRRASELLQHVVTHTPAVIYSLKLERDGIVPRFANENITRLLGYPVEDAMSYEWWLSRLHPEDAPRALASVDETLAQGESRTEYRLFHKDGSIRWVDDQRRLIRDAEGLPAEMVGVWTDITERRDALSELAAQREHWSALVNCAADALFVVQDDRVEFVNPAALHLFGAASESEVVGLDIYAFVLDRYHEKIRARSRLAVTQTEPLPPLETRMRRLDGSIVDVESNSVRLMFRGRPAVLVAARDIGERNHAARVLHESERRFREMLENVDLIAVMLDASGTVTFCNDFLLRLTGWKREEALGSDWFAEFVGDACPRAKQVFSEGMAQGDIPRHFENPIRARNGVLRHIVWSNTLLRDETGRVIGIAGVGEDVTDRRRAEQRLKVQYAAASVLAESTSVDEAAPKILAAICGESGFDVGELWLVDGAANTARCTALWAKPDSGLGEFVAMSREFTVGPGHGLAGRVWSSREPMWCPNVADESDCPRREAAMKADLCTWIGFPIQLRQDTLGVVGFFAREVRSPDAELLVMLTALGAQFGQFIERKRVEKQFYHAQKMEALGALAGGVAHDFNNVLAAISGYCELARMNPGEHTAVDSHLDGIFTGAKRAIALVRQILAFSRGQAQERRPIQLRHIVADALRLLRAATPAMVEIDSNLATLAPVVLADATQVHQIVMNLGTNAAHAMRAHGGRLTVKLDECVVDDSLVVVHPGLRVGRYVRLTVADTGHGMDAATLLRIFEPFFTTKPAEEGTGLGLAVVHGIVQAHEGVITVASRPDEGTTFTVYFPAHEAEVVEAAPAATETPRGSGQRILIVDDEPAIAEISQRVLKHLGYAADARTDPGEALELVRANPAAYALAITDHAMPGISGIELTRRLRALRPDLPVVLTTGYAEGVPPDQLRAAGFAQVLVKPLTVESLAGAVRQALSTVPATLS